MLLTSEFPDDKESGYLSQKHVSPLCRCPAAGQRSRKYHRRHPVTSRCDLTAVSWPRTSPAHDDRNPSYLQPPAPGFHICDVVSHRPLCRATGLCQTIPLAPSGLVVACRLAASSPRGSCRTAVFLPPVAGQTCHR